MRVPTYEERFGRVEKIAPTTQAPAMPQISTPRVAPGAFGVGTGEAFERLGRIGEKIAGQFLQLAQDRQDKEVLDRETAFMQNWQNRLFDNESETVNIGGKEVTRPKGFLLRQLDQAEGVTEEAGYTYQKIREQYLDGLSKYQYDKLAPNIDRHSVSIQDRLLVHEANQRDESFKLSTENNLKLKTLDASTIRDGKQLSFAIDDALKSAVPYYAKYDEATRGVLNEGIRKNVIDAAIMSTLTNTGDLNGAVVLLDSVKKDMPQSTYDELKSKLAKGYDAMQSEIEKVRLETRVSDRFNYIAQVANGTIDWQNSGNVIRDIATKDPDLAEAVKKAVETSGGYVSEEINNESFQALAKDIFNAGDAETISKFLLQALTDNKNISKDRLAVLVDAAQLRAKELPTKATGKNRPAQRGFLDSAFTNIMASNPITASVVLFNTLKRMKSENPQKENILTIANDEIRKQRLIDSPDIAKVPAEGQMWGDKYGARWIQYPDGTIKIIQTKSGEFIHKEQRKKE